MYVANELARSNAYYGAWALSTNAPELPDRRRRRARERDRGVLARRQGEHPDPRRHGLHLGVRLPPLLPPREAARAQPRQRAPMEGRIDHALEARKQRRSWTVKVEERSDGLQRHHRTKRPSARGARLAREERRAQARRVRDVGRALRRGEGPRARKDYQRRRPRPASPPSRGRRSTAAAAARRSSR